MVDGTLKAQIAQLHVGLIGRAPDRSGLEFWADGYQQNLDKGRSEPEALRVMAQQMFESDGARNYYPEGSTDRAIVSQFYENVLGRKGDEQGITFWTDALDRAPTTGHVLVEMIEAVKGYAGDDPEGQTSQALFNNKSAVAIYYGTEVSQPGEAAIEESTTLLEAVGVDTDVSDDNALTAFVADNTSNDPNRTFTLDKAGATLRADNVVGASPNGVSPGSGNDVFIATSASLDDSVIEGGAGRDVLRIEALEADVSPNRAESVEVVEVTGQGTDGRVDRLDAANMDGAEAIWSVGSRGDDLAVTNIQAPATIGLRGSHDPLTYNPAFAPSVLNGGNDEIRLELDGVQAREHDQDAPSVRIDDAETVSVDNTGTTTPGGAIGTAALNVTGDSLEALQIAGGGELDIASDSPALNVIDATEFSGSDLSVDIRSVTQNALEARVSSAQDVSLIVGADLLATDRSDVSLTLSAGLGGDDYGLLGVAGIDSAAAVNALDLSAGDINGVDLVAIGNDEASGIRLEQAATLDLRGVAAPGVFWTAGDPLDLAGRVLTIANVSTDTLDLDFGDAVTGGGGLLVRDVAGLEVDPQRGLGSVGDPIDLTGSSATALTLDADGSAAIELDAIALSSGRADQRDVLSLNLEGGNRIAGSLTLGATNVNQVAFENKGSGDRDIRLDGIADLKVSGRAGETAGEGVTVTGDGTGNLTLSADAGDISELAVDATSYRSGEAVVVIDASVPEILTVGAEAFAGVDRVDIATNDFDGRIQDLGAATTVGISADADVELLDVAAVRDVTLANAEVGALAVNSADTLNLRPTEASVQLDDLGANGTDTINIATTTENGSAASLTIADRFDARNGDRAETFALNIEGAGDVVFDNGIDIGVPGERYVLNADGGGARQYGEVLLSSLGRDETLTFGGNSDYSATLVFQSTGQGASTVALDSGGDATVEAFKGTISRDERVTLNSESGTGRGENIIRDTSAFEIDGGATLAVTGNQALTINDNLDLTQRDDEAATLDASKFSGDLTLALARDIAGRTSVDQVIALGSGSDTLSVAPASENSSSDDTFTFAIDTTAIGEDRIEGFAADSTVDDRLDFSAYFADIDGYRSDVAGDMTRGQLENSAGDALVEFRNVDADGDGRRDDLRASSDAFEGELALIGVTQDALSIDNFVMSG